MNKKTKVPKRPEPNTTKMQADNRYSEHSPPMIWIVLIPAVVVIIWVLSVVLK